MRTESRLRTWVRGLALLRRPQLVHHLGLLAAKLDLIERLRLANPGALVDADVVLDCEEGQVRMGAGSRISTGCIVSLGDARFGTGELHVGARSWIGQYTNMRANDGTRIVIGDDCLIGQFSTLLGSQHSLDPARPIREQPADPRRRDLTIGNDVWVGTCVTILPGIRIGEGAVIGANSLVVHDVPAGEIWAGAPARKLRSRP